MYIGERETKSWNRVEQLRAGLEAERVKVEFLQAGLDAANKDRDEQETEIVGLRAELEAAQQVIKYRDKTICSIHETASELKAELEAAKRCPICATIPNVEMKTHIENCHCNDDLGVKRAEAYEQGRDAAIEEAAGVSDGAET